MNNSDKKTKNHYAMVMITIFIVISALAIISVVGVTLDSLKVTINNDRVKSFSNLSVQSFQMLDDTIVSTKYYSKMFAESFGSGYNSNQDMYDYFQKKVGELEDDNSVFLIVDGSKQTCFTSTGYEFVIDVNDASVLSDEETVLIDYLVGPPEPKYMIFMNKLETPFFANYRGETVKITHTAVALSMDYIISKVDSNIPVDADTFVLGEDKNVISSRQITGLGMTGDEFFDENFIENVVKDEDREFYVDKLNSGESFTYEYYYKGKKYAVGISKIANTDMRCIIVINPDNLGDSVESALYRIITLCTVIVSLLGFSVFFITFYFKKSKIDKQLLIEKQEIQEKLENNLKIVARQKGELEKQQNELESALKMANSSSRAKTAFLSNMSHDIRTPMNAIMGYTTLAASNLDDGKKVKDYLDKIDSSSKHLLSLINEILDMSSIESGMVELSNTNVKLSEVVETVKNLLSTEAGKKKQVFIIEENIAHDTVKCDRLRLEQVILNVVGNSIKYTKDGGRIKLSVDAKEASDGKVSVCFVVTDNGVGMSDEFVSTIFDPFTRVSSSTISGVDGTGLGMAIAGKIIDKMDGKCHVESKENVGTTVTLTFEFEAVKEAEVELKDASETEFNGKKVLIVEDNKLNAEIAEEILTERGFIVDIVDDGSVAVETVKEKDPGCYDAILMDIQMPIMDGYEATMRIRALDDEEKKNIPIIAMTANAFEDDVKMAFESGMNGHVAKPVDIKVLMNALRGVLSKC